MPGDVSLDPMRTGAAERTPKGWVARFGAYDGRPPDARDAVAAILDEVRAGGGGRLELWVEQAEAADDDAPRRAGFTHWRDLWQLRCALPEVVAAHPAELVTRAFTDADAAEFLAVNNRAFDWHPEQGSLTLDDLRARRREPWFDADGFRLHERPDAQGRTRLAGFCWTKVHPARPAGTLGAADPGDPALGEIYAIAVDPDFHGQGLGGPMTLAGLRWLADHGLATGMLYVESDNHAANRVYERLGFTRHHIDRAWVLDVAP